MTKLFNAVLVAVSLMAAPVAAESPFDSTRGVVYAYLGWMVTSGDPGAVVTTGRNGVLTDASLDDVFGAIVLNEVARFTLSNLSEATVGLSLQGNGFVGYHAFINTRGVGFDSGATLTVSGPGIDFKASRSRRGVYTCTNDIDFSPDRDCFGLTDNGEYAGFGPSVSLFLAAGESVSYDFRATARAALGPGVAAVPLPAGGALLALGLGGLALLRRRGGRRRG